MACLDENGKRGKWNYWLNIFFESIIKIEVFVLLLLIIKGLNFKDEAKNKRGKIGYSGRKNWLEKGTLRNLKYQKNCKKWSWNMFRKLLINLIRA